jgi:hypothetical protein
MLLFTFYKSYLEKGRVFLEDLSPHRILESVLIVVVSFPLQKFERTGLHVGVNNCAEV